MLPNNSFKPIPFCLGLIEVSDQCLLLAESGNRTGTN